jgi:hypothetical protein
MSISFFQFQSLQFNDAATYDNTPLDFGGSVILNGLTHREQTVSDSSSSIGSQLRSAIPNSLREAVGLVGSLVLPRQSAAAVGIATRTSLNKNIVTEFNGVGTRQFSFQFKLMTVSVEEAKIIKKICEVFRANLYPTGNSLQLSYPPTWYINFKKDGKDISYIPKIFECYLSNISTVYNASSNLWHPDGSPVETDLQISFVESRALTQHDIKTLVDRPFKDGDFNVAYKISSEAVQETINATKKIQDAVSSLKITD